MKIPSPPHVEPPSRFSWSFAGTRPFLAFVIGVVLATGVLFGQDARGIKKESLPKDRPAAAVPSGAKLEAAVTVARERAKLLNDVYTTTLDVMHHRYFRQDGPVLPARAMEDVFEGVAGLSGDKANWISVNTKAMSINHEPATVFEKQAAAELSTGKEDFELVGDGVYQRAVAIPLRARCVGCHTKMFSEPPKTPRYAALVISIPLKLEKK